MVRPIDTGTFKNDAGQDVFSYAHPVFWAPFSVVGEREASAPGVN